MIIVFIINLTRKLRRLVQIEMNLTYFVDRKIIYTGMNALNILHELIIVKLISGFLSNGLYGSRPVIISNLPPLTYYSCTHKSPYRRKCSLEFRYLITLEAEVCNTHNILCRRVY